MLSEQTEPDCFSEIGASIKRQIVKRTGRQIESLNVELIGGRIVITGYAVSYYYKQLALQGVLDVVGQSAEFRIELNIDVVGAPHRSAAEGSHGYRDYGERSQDWREFQ